MENVIGVPRIDDLLDHRGKAKYFSVFELPSAFWWMPMRKSDKKYVRPCNHTMKASNEAYLKRMDERPSDQRRLKSLRRLNLGDRITQIMPSGITRP